MSYKLKPAGKDSKELILLKDDQPTYCPFQTVYIVPDQFNRPQPIKQLCTTGCVKMNSSLFTGDLKKFHICLKCGTGDQIIEADFEPLNPQLSIEK